ncbi:MAG: RnfH family protein, partial [Burkholderiaceae bacterium]
PLQPYDQLSLCRPLLVDPKTARRQRFEAQGSRRAGLFATRRPGAKPGY